MREIKFRVWDKQYKVMETVTHLDFNTRELDYFGNWNEPKNWEHFKIMQFTGLKDKNGTEIYEGDILRCDDVNEGHEPFMTEVVFRNGGFHTTHYGFPVWSWTHDCRSWCEVIGNIHQNPELLEAK